MARQEVSNAILWLELELMQVQYCRPSVAFNFLSLDTNLQPLRSCVVVNLPWQLGLCWSACMIFDRSNSTSRSYMGNRLWCLKMAVFDLLAKLIAKIPYERIIVWGFWIALLSTFVASIVTVFIGCRPLKQHWQIYPDPGDWYANLSSTLLS